MKRLILFSWGFRFIAIVLFSEKTSASGGACIVRFVDGDMIKHGDCSQHDVTPILKDIRRMAANEATQVFASACASNPCNANASCQDSTNGWYICKCNDGYTGNGQICTLIKNTKQDILFLIQNGGSISSVNFQKLLRFTQALVKTLCGGADVGRDQTRISVHSFGAGELSHISFNDFLTKSEVLKKIGSISYKDTPASLCCLNKTLEYVKDNLFTLGNGARMNDRDVKKEVFLLSDGCRCQSSVTATQSLKGLGNYFSTSKISIINVLIGTLPTKDMERLSQLDDGSRCYSIYRFSFWSELDIATDRIEAAGCSQTTIGTTCS